MATPRISLTPARPSDASVVRRLMQFYCYDFSEFETMPISDDAVYGNEDFIEEQFGPNHDTYLIRINEKPAGFAIVTGKSHLSGDKGVTDMTQFFVPRPWRRLGVGEAAAHELFNRYPGPWEVRVVERNLNAETFWREIIRRYTEDAFVEEHLAGPRHHGAVFTFEAT